MHILPLSILLCLSFLVQNYSYCMEGESQRLIQLREELLRNAQSMVSGRNPRNASSVRLKSELKEASPRKFANGIIHKLDQQLLADLRKKGITDELLQKHRQLAAQQMEKDYCERKKNRQPASSPFRDLVHSVQAVMEGPAIEAVTDKNSTHSASTDDYQIIINEEKLHAKYNKDAIPFILAHEKQHANSRHSLNRRAVYTALCEIDGGKLTPSSVKLYYKYLRRQEAEADLCPALKNAGFAAGYQSFANSLVKKDGKGKAETHPLNTHRAQSADSAVNFMAEYAAAQLSKKRRMQEEGLEQAPSKKKTPVNRTLFQESNHE